MAVNRTLVSSVALVAMIGVSLWVSRRSRADAPPPVAAIVAKPTEALLPAAVGRASLAPTTAPVVNSPAILPAEPEQSRQQRLKRFGDIPREKIERIASILKDYA